MKTKDLKMTILDMKKPHYVYLMGGVGTKFFKIGMSKDVKQRKRQYSLPFELKVSKCFLARDALDLEKRIQALYHDHRCRGEWFADLSPEHFISDIEWLAMKDYVRAEKEYYSRNPKRRKRNKKQKIVVSRKTSYSDRTVLETLRQEGLRAAQSLRKEIQNV
jgi:T5orf172 domain